MGLFGNISGYMLMTIKTKVLRALGSNLKFLEPWVRSSWELNFKFLTETRRGVSHRGLAIYKEKEEELWKFKYFSMQKYNLQKNPLKKIKILQDIINSITNLKFQHKPKYHLSEILI